ncbi:hypothetical protein YC2023_089024 [Brassica napus]
MAFDKGDVRFGCKLLIIVLLSLVHYHLISVPKLYLRFNLSIDDSRGISTDTPFTTSIDYSIGISIDTLLASFAPGLIK